MSNSGKLQTAFAAALGVEETQITDSLKYQSIVEWDSISHMVLITELEDAFDVSIDTDDVIDMSSVAKAKEILAKLGVDFS
jgi:acyl carrier protein